MVDFLQDLFLICLMSMFGDSGGQSGGHRRSPKDISKGLYEDCKDGKKTK